MNSFLALRRFFSRKFINFRELKCYMQWNTETHTQCTQRCKIVPILLSISEASNSLRSHPCSYISTINGLVKVRHLYTYHYINIIVRENLQSETQI